MDSNAAMQDILGIQRRATDIHSTYTQSLTSSFNPDNTDNQHKEQPALNNTNNLIELEAFMSQIKLEVNHLKLEVHTAALDVPYDTLLMHSKHVAVKKLDVSWCSDLEYDLVRIIDKYHLTNPAVAALFVPYLGLNKNKGSANRLGGLANDARNASERTPESLKTSKSSATPVSKSTSIPLSPIKESISGVNHSSSQCVPLLTLKKWFDECQAWRCGIVRLREKTALPRKRYQGHHLWLYKTRLSVPVQLSSSKDMAGARYISPELIGMVIVSSAQRQSDVYAFGVIVYEILIGGEAYSGNLNANQIYERTLAGKRHSI
ncbi:hypothetical protein BSLG_005892 [Batrachochytrium salamandrivorans]|nr:hypothetical protein BSLG_005892 [Batrachochytrium salamandrivorans]